MHGYQMVWLTTVCDVPIPSNLHRLYLSNKVVDLVKLVKIADLQSDTNIRTISYVFCPISLHTVKTPIYTCLETKWFG